MFVAAPTAAAASWPELGPLPADGSGAADAAVVVGIEDYLAVPDVPGARANAELWYDWLARTRGVPLPHLRLLRDTEATREVVLDEVRRAGAAVGPGGVVWVVFVGHGAPALDGADGVLVGADAQQTARQLYDRSVARAELEAAVGAGHDAVFVLDTCFSGSVGGAPLVPGLQPLIPTWALASTGATSLLAAGGGEFAGPLPGLGRPAFSYLALGGLRGWADADRDGAVTASELQRYTRDTLAAVLVDRAQTPELAGPDRVLARGSEPPPDVAAIVRDLPAAVVTWPTHPVAADDWLGRIWTLRHTEEGRRRVEAELGSVFPGVGTAGVIAGTTRMTEFPDNQAVNPYSNCFAEGSGLPVNRSAEGLRRWRCGELKRKDWARVEVVLTPSFAAWAREPGGVVWYLDAPNVEYAALFDHALPALSVPGGPAVGMALDEALARVPAAPDSRDDVLVAWHALGLELLHRDGVVRSLRVREAAGRAP